MIDVYYHKNTITGEGYVGISAKGLEKRWKEHKYFKETKGIKD